MSTEKKTKHAIKANTSVIDRVYIHALRQRFIRMSEIRVIVGKDATARMIAWKLVKQGRLSRVKGGFFVAIPLERIGIGYEPDRYLLMDRMMESAGAIAYHSALELHGVAQSPHNRVYYIIEETHRWFKHDGITYVPITTDASFGLTKTFREEHEIAMTDKERTFLDCMRRLDLCGGFEEFYKSVKGFKTLKPVTLMRYLEKYSEESLYMRTGFVLELLEDTMEIDDEFNEYLRSHVSRSPAYLIPSKKKGNKLNKDWNLLHPVNLEDMIRNA